MRYIAIMLLLFASITAYTQSESWPIPDKAKRADCVTSKKKESVIKGSFYLVASGNTIPSDTFYFCEMDSMRVAYQSNSLLRPLIENGIMNGHILRKAGVGMFKADEIMYERGVRFQKEDGTDDNWTGDYISFGEMELVKYKRNNARVFRLSANRCFFYLELINNSASTNTSTSDFVKNAYVLCLVRWYCEI